MKHTVRVFDKSLNKMVLKEVDLNIQSAVRGFCEVKQCGAIHCHLWPFRLSK